ncbi:ribonuclease P protein component [Lysobacter lycopersici]
MRQRADFARVFETGRRVAAPALALHWLASEQPRLGIAVSRKVDPNAVGRNRIKRALREAFRNLRPQLAPADFVLVARTPATTLDNAALRSVFSQLLLRAGALPAAVPTGTMRAACEPAPPTPSKSDTHSG